MAEKRNRRNKNKLLRDTIAAMALCNNVTANIENGKVVEYIGSSPDEVALVKLASKLGMTLMKRSDSSICIENAAGESEFYEIIAIFPFSSESKRMGIILKSEKYEHIVFLAKGAETVMEKLLGVFAISWQMLLKFKAAGFVSLI
jgi:phospholipid-translocating ATPase